MKAILQKVPVFTDASFAVQEFRTAGFDVPWHFHPEYELVLIVKSRGKRFVGDNIMNFGPGSLVLLGPNLPHLYRNDAHYYRPGSTQEAISIVVQFTEDFLGGPFFAIPEASAIRQVLEESVRGLEIRGKTRDQISAQMHDFLQLQGMDRVLLLLSVLNTLAGTREYNILSSKGTVKLNTEDSRRINRVHEFVMNHFTEPISSEEVSGLVNMCPSTFCRYFKKRTRKTFTSFLNEIRIGHACRLLMEEDVTITEVCFMSGFNNISHFNRQFKALKNKTPQVFRREYLQRGAQ